MSVYVYDGTFEGLLCALYVSLKRRERPDQIMAAAEEPVDLFSPMFEVQTTAGEVCTCYEFIRDHLSPRSLSKIFFAYLAQDKKREQKILNYFILGQREGPRIDRLLAEPVVRDIDELVYKVRRETHRLQGLIRFQELASGIYFAQISPDHNILTLLAQPFAERMADLSWVIADVKRARALYYDQGESQLIPWSSVRLPKLATGEKKCADLWQEYFRAIAIQERRNPRLQRQCLPRRYWKYLVEKPGDLQ